MPSKNNIFDHLPRSVWLVLALYFCASLLHFWHNAEFIVFYPNMPQWLTREKVYLAWLAVTVPGVLGVALLRLGWKAGGVSCLAVYGALGLDGLGHYTLALCSEHTWAMNATIGFEVATGLTLAVCCLAIAVRSWLPANARAA